jgi:hypothetical protein
MIKFTQFNYIFGTTIIQPDDQDSENHEYEWQQRRMAPQIYSVNRNGRTGGARNRLSKPRETTSDNLTGCLQRDLVFGYEKQSKMFKFQNKQHGIANKSQPV